MQDSDDESHIPPCGRERVIWTSDLFLHFNQLQSLVVVEIKLERYHFQIDTVGDELQRYVGSLSNPCSKQWVKCYASGALDDFAFSSEESLWQLDHYCDRVSLRMRGSSMYYYCCTRGVAILLATTQLKMNICEFHPNLLRDHFS
jgi:hypothetical protein